MVYLHGTPDSRLGRHPDDTVAAAAGVRLLAIDRPGAGGSDLHPAGNLAGLGHDLTVLLDELGIDRTLLLGWSAGGLSALAAASVVGDRVAAVAVVAPIPPVEAYENAALVAALAPARRAFVTLAGDLAAAELAAEVAPYLLPSPLTAETALVHVLEGAGDSGSAELAMVPGAAEQLARSLEASAAHGSAGLVQDVARQLEPGLELGRVLAPVRCFHGDEDGLSPPEVGTWLAARLPNAVVDLVPGGSHHLLFPRWHGILRALRRDAAM